MSQFKASMALRAQPKQVAAAAAVVRRFLWHAGALRPGQITTASVAAYLAALKAAGRAPKTIRNHCSAISEFCQELQAAGMLGGNPCEGVRIGRLEQRPPRWLSDDQVAATLAVARRTGCWPEICLAVSTGLRLGELIRLQWADVDLARRTMLVRKSKSGRPRSVPLCRSAIVALRWQRRISGPMAYVFPARRTWRHGWRYEDRPRASNWWRRAMRPIQAEVAQFLAGVGPCSVGRGWHLLRHTFASRAAQAGVSLYKLAAWLGHRDVRTTEMYAHLQAGYEEAVEAAAVNTRRRHRK